MAEVKPVSTHSMSGEPAAPHAPHPAEPAPQTIADQQRQAGAPRPATNYPKPPVQHHHEPAPVLGVSASPPTEGPGKDLAELRASADPWLYDHVIAYHPHAAETDVHLQAFKEDYERQKAAGETQRSARDKAAADEKAAADPQHHDERAPAGGVVAQDRSHAGDDGARGSGQHQQPQHQPKR